VVEFGRHLPSLRAAVTVDLAKSGLGKRRVVATAVRLLDIGLFRVGGEEYADEHETFGIATLRKEHVSLHDGQLVFEYPAKGSVARMVAVRDQEAATVVRRLRNRRGGSDCLLAWKDKGGWHDVRSTDINAYIKAEMGQDFSAKDFRTWSATVLAACTLAAMTEERRDRRMTSKAVAAATKEVAESLGNTPAVCRSSYIDPRIIDHFAAGETITRRPNPTDITLNQLSRRSVIEAEVLDLLSADDSAAAS
jgi:DNA topoisomerase IB